MKILLIEPSRYLGNGKLLKSKQVLVPSLTLPYLAALLPNDIDVSIVNELLDEIDFTAAVDLVGITSYTHNIRRAYDISDEFRKRRVPVVMGGIHVSMEPVEAGKHADTLIVGEADEIWPQFISDFQKGASRTVYQNASRPTLVNLPVPRFNLVNPKKYFAYQQSSLRRLLAAPVIPIQTARGCPYSCDYCSVTRFSGGQYRPRPIADVIAEIKALHAKTIFFVDDNIFASPARARELFTALIPCRVSWFANATVNAADDPEMIRLARRSGCSFVCLGLESLSPDSLAAVKKGINRVEKFAHHLQIFHQEGISVGVSMMFGFDGEGIEAFASAYRFLIDNHATYTFWWPATPLPGTPFYQNLKAQGRLKQERWWLHRTSPAYSLHYQSKDVDEKAFAENFFYYFRRFYSLRNTVKRVWHKPRQRLLYKVLLNRACRSRITRQTNILEH